MKKIISVSISLAVIVCSLFAFNITAFANTKSKAAKIALGQTVSATVSNEDDTPQYYWLKFDCLTTNYYETVTSLTESSTGDVILNVYDSNSKVVNIDVNNSPSLEKVTTTYFEAGKSYYFRYEISESTLKFNVSLRVHNHSYSTPVSAMAVADDDGENSLDGFYKYVCTACGCEYVAQVYTAPVSAVTSGVNFVYTSLPVAPQINVYDRNGNIVSPSEYVVTYDDNIKPGKAYAYIDFIGANTKGQLTTSFIILPQKQTAVSLKSNKSKQITFNWNKDTTVTGYEIQYGTSSKFASSKTKSVIVSKNSTKSKTFTKLKSKKKYYARIRAYKTIDGVRQFGAWSNKVSVKTK